MKILSTNTIGLAQKINSKEPVKKLNLKIATPVYACVCCQNQY